MINYNVNSFTHSDGPTEKYHQTEVHSNTGASERIVLVLRPITFDNYLNCSHEICFQQPQEAVSVLFNNTTAEHSSSKQTVIDYLVNIVEHKAAK